MAKVKITVVKKLDRNVIHADSRLRCSCKGPPVCPLFEEGQEFVTDMTGIPAGFCPGAYADLFRFITGLQAGASQLPPPEVEACNVNRSKRIV